MKGKDKLFTILLSFLLIVFPLYRLVTYTMNALGVTSSFLFDFNKVYLLWFTLPFFVSLYIVRIIHDEYKITIFDYLCYLLLILGLLTSIFAINKEISIFGIEYRDEGLITIFTYIFIFLNAKNVKDNKVINYLINLFLIISFIEVIYSILQVCTSLSFIRHYSIHYMASGLSGNPNFLGSYLVMAFAIAVVYYLSKKDIKYLLLSFMYFLGVILASSTGPFLAAIITALLLIYYIVKRVFNIKQYIILVISLIICFFFTSYLINITNKNVYIEPNYNISKEVESIISSNDNEYKFSNGRIDLWKASLPLLKEYPIVGAGFDNFRYAFSGNSNYLVYDKAHNIYLEMGICSGGLYLLVYLIICIILVIKYFKNNNHTFIALFLAFLAYSIQGIANINVIDICFIFWLFMGFVNRLGETN